MQGRRIACGGRLTVITCGGRSVMDGTRGGGSAAANQDRPIGDLAQQLSEQVSRLVREELRLAELEMTRKGKRLGFGAAMFGGAGAIALYGVAAILAAVILLLAKVMPAW